MRTARAVLGFGCLVALALPAWGQGVLQTGLGRRPCPPPNCAPPYLQPTPDGRPAPDPGTPQTPPQPGMAQQPTTDAFAQASEGGGMPGSSSQPGFFGDLIGINGLRSFNGPGGNAVVSVPSASRGAGFKVADSESPRPQDRVYYNFNYFSDVNQSVNARVGAPGFNVSRHIVGVEKTFLRGDASVGLRLPFVSVTGIPQFNDQQFADMSIVTKYAVINDQVCGRVASVGLVVTVPTGRGMVVDLPNPRTGTIIGPNPTTIFSTSLQPFAGYYRELSPTIYVHGFSSLVVPTTSLDVVLLTGDSGIGWYLYKNAQDRFIQSIIPTFEVHTNTALNYRGPQAQPISFRDQINLTSGCYFVLPRSTLGVAVGVPVMGPRPYSLEALASYNLRF